MNTRTKTRITAILIFILISITYYKLPTTQTTDSLYSILLTETIIKNKEIELSKYFNNASNPEMKVPYQIEQINDNKYYYFPHGSSFLSIPFVYILNNMGINTIEDGNYSLANEIKIQKILSTALTAATVVIIFLTLRLFSSYTTSLLLTFIFAFATPLASTLSRGLWAHTWLVLLLSIAIFIILRNIKNKTLPNPYILATLMALMYFVRPISSISIIAISILCLFYFKKIILKYCATGAIWLLAFTTYSYYNFSSFQPSYYLANRLGNEQFLSALVGNLFSPSRGLFVYSCFLIPILYLAIKNKSVEHYKVILSIAFITIISHLLVISSFPHWWGGYSYGPRFMSDMIPWLVVITAVSIYNKKTINKYILSVFILTSILSILVNTWAAYNPKTIEWNGVPDNIDLNPDRLWDWKHPPFLAGIQQLSIEKKFPIIEENKTVILFNSVEADDFIIDGWSNAESSSRWTDGETSRIGFNLEKIEPISISIKLEPFIGPEYNLQNIIFYMNDNHLEEYKFELPRVENILLNVPAKYLKEKNILTIKIPNAISPESVKMSEDKRKLGISVYNITFQKGN